MNVLPVNLLGSERLLERRSGLSLNTGLASDSTETQACRHHTEVAEKPICVCLCRCLPLKIFVFVFVFVFVTMTMEV